MKSRYVLLSFDVEEFDMPLEYGTSITATEQLSAGKKGLDAIAPILNHPNIASTLFTTAHFATQFSESIQSYSAKHEIASHTYYHSWFTPEHLKTSKAQLEKIIDAPVTGLRMPRMKAVDLQWVADAGYEYDSSLHPTWIPGKYNHLRATRTLSFQSDIPQLPASVSPNLRIPLFWLSFKNFPYSVYKKLVLQTLRKDGYCCLYFHPWEFIDISSYGLPKFTYRIQGEALVERLYRLIGDLEKEASFISIRDFIQQRSPKT